MNTTWRNGWWLLALPPLMLMVWLVVGRNMTGPPTAPAVPVVRQVKLPPGYPDTFGKALAQADREVLDAQTRAREHPDEWTVQEALARRYMSRGRLTGSFEDYAAAQAALDRAFKVAAPGAGPHHTQAALHFTMHRLDAAEALLDVIDRYAVRPDIEERAEIVAMRGDIAFYRGDYARARARYAEADALEPGASGAFRQAVYATKTGQLDAAARGFDQTVRASRMPTPQMRANVELQKGTLDLERGRWADALAQFQRADAIFPGHWLIEEHIAEALALMGDTQEAERRYRRLVTATNNPEFMDALAALADARGDEAGAARWRKRAQAGWDRRMALFPEAAYGHALGHAVASGDTAKALDLARKNHAARPYGDAKVSLAAALLAAGQPGAARGMIEQVLASPWKTAQTHAVAAQVYDAMAARPEAARQRDLALAINPHELDNPAHPLPAFN